MDDVTPELDDNAFRVLHTLAIQPAGMTRAALQNTAIGVDQPAALVDSLGDAGYVSFAPSDTGSRCTITDAGRSLLDAYMRRSGQ